MPVSTPPAASGTRTSGTRPRAMWSRGRRTRDGGRGKPVLRSARVIASTLGRAPPRRAPRHRDLTPGVPNRWWQALDESVTEGSMTLSQRVNWPRTRNAGGTAGRQTRPYALAMRSVTRRIALSGSVLAGFTALAVLCTLSLWASPLARLPTGPGSGAFDPFNAAWWLNWTPFAISHGLDPFTSNYLNYPSGMNMMWNSWMPAL